MDIADSTFCHAHFWTPHCFNASDAPDVLPIRELLDQTILLDTYRRICSTNSRELNVIHGQCAIYNTKTDLKCSSWVEGFNTVHVTLKQEEHSHWELHQHTMLHSGNGGSSHTSCTDRHRNHIMYMERDHFSVLKNQYVGIVLPTVSQITFTTLDATSNTAIMSWEKLKAQRNLNPNYQVH